jgi:hypothetical protein
MKVHIYEPVVNNWKSDSYDYVTASTTALQTGSTAYETRPKHPPSYLKCSLVYVKGKDIPVTGRGGPHIT